MFTLLLLVSIPTVADFTIDNRLDFGEIAISRNDVISSTHIYRDGAQVSTNRIYILRAGSPGVFTLSDLPPFTNVDLSVDLPASSAMNYSDTAQFSITAVDLPSAINVGPTGSAQFKMGGTLSTSGNPANNYYSGAEYLIFLNLNLDY
jgi:hypothetical protein